VLGLFSVLQVRAQNCSMVQPPLSACASVTENFNSGAGGFLGTNLAHTSNNFSTILSNAVSPATLSIVSPAYYKLATMPNTVVAGYHIGVGFKITLNSITMQVLDAGSGDAVIASCQQTVSINDIHTNICFSITSASIVPGKMLKYKFIFETTIAQGGNNSQNTFSVDDFSNGDGLNAPLPVVFGKFEARVMSNSVLLNWEIKSEDNTEYFEVERSTDGVNYVSVGQVEDKGAASYDFIDTKPVNEAYYRIKAVDVDSKYNYSVVLKVNSRGTGVISRAFFSNKNVIEVQHDAFEKAGRMEIIAADGSLLGSVYVAAGTQRTVLNVGNARPGMLLVRYVSDDKSVVFKLIKN
jgi:hypothetical protein